MFNKHEDRPMNYGTCGGWHMDPHPWEKRHHKGPHHHPPQMGYFMMPMMHDRWHHRDHKPHMSCLGRKTWKHGTNHHEMNPQKLHDMFPKMQRMKEESPNNENFARGTLDHHRHGFCRRKFTTAGPN